MLAARFGASQPLLRQFAEREGDGLLFALTDQIELDRGPRRRPADPASKRARILDRLAVDGGDHIAGLDAGLSRRTPRLRLGDQCAIVRLQPEAVGDVGIDRLNLDADPSACHRALVLELLDDRAHRLRRNRKGDSDRTARRREDRGVHADYVAVDVTLKVKSFPCYFLPVALLRRNRPLLFFFEEFR